MSNSKLVTYQRISPNKTSPRNHIIDTITIHCYVGQVTAERGCNSTRFTKYNPVSGASCNYVVGHDGSIGLCVDESDRSWCSSNRANDHRAVTIEVASETVPPYRVTDKAYKALVELVTDICKRNNINQLRWQGDKSLIGNVAKQNMTVHRWFAAKACPGDYLYDLHGQIASEVNAKLGVAAVAPSAYPYKVKVTASTLNVRRGPGTLYSKTTSVKRGEVYTIVEEKNGWGRLKSGAGWICLKYSDKIK